MKVLISICLIVLSETLLAQPTNHTIVFLNKRADAAQLPKEESDKIMEGHMANIKKLAAEGKLVAAGPFDGGGGIFILKAKSEDEVREWLSAGPGVQAKCWDLEIFSYGSIAGSICHVNEPYEMVSYSFARFDAVVSKFNASTYPQIIKKHFEFLKQLQATGNMVTSATLGNEDASIVIMKGDVGREIFEGDPGVQEGLLDLTIKKLYIAKGSFCEK
jgi:uncharacterized protein YciI